MENLLAARLQMALSLGFHIIFASIGIAMPFLMATSYAFFLKRRDPDYKILTHAWSKGVAIFFAIGAVSGTALSFELGLLWPGFMKYAGPIIGMPFSWEGTAFFLEAIALGIFLYGWGKIPERIHWLSGLAVGISGVASAYFVICANAWMNSPAGFEWNHGQPLNIDPWAAMFNDASTIQGIHMIAAAFQAVGFAVAGVHAALFLRTRYAIHFKGLKIALFIGAVAAIVQPLIGHFAAQSVAERQPMKLAAMESLFKTQKSAPFVLGGIPSKTDEKLDFAIEIPGLLSWLAFGDTEAEVKGLDQIPRENWPPVAVTHFSFQIMILLGSLLAGVGLFAILAIWMRMALLESKFFLIVLCLCIPLGFIALEAGWIVTETGRQPWIIYGILKTKDALTPRPGIGVTFFIYCFLYLFLTFIAGVLLYRQTQLLHFELKGKKA